MTQIYRRLALALTGLALVVAMAGAYVRLSDAGLGCPDWPGCYGRLTAPTTPQELAAAAAAFGREQVDPAKAWIEMGHRYAAGLLGALILALTLLAWRWRAAPGVRPLTASALLGVVLLQVLLGMWTVTLLVKPLVVTAHLLGGMLTVALCFVLALPPSPPTQDRRGARVVLAVALAALFMQIALGGWTSSNYAALACPTFPGCLPDRAWPPMAFGEAFQLWRGLDTNYEFGVLDAPARAAIQMSHRLGALVTLGVLVLAALFVWRRHAGDPGLARALVALFALLALQFTLGIANVVAQRPLMLAVAHNGVAALLLLTLVYLYHRVGAAARKEGG